MEPYMDADPRNPIGNDPERPVTYGGEKRPTTAQDDRDPKSLAEEREEERAKEAYAHDARIGPEKYPFVPAIDANPPGKEYPESARERGERGIGGMAFGLVFLSMFGLALLGYLAFTWNQPSTSTTAMNEQPTATEQTVPDTGTGQTTQPAQPAQPEQPPPAGDNTTQP